MTSDISVYNLRDGGLDPLATMLTTPRLLQRQQQTYRLRMRFHLPHLHLTSPLGGFPSEYRHPVWYGKTRMVWLPNGEKISKISLFSRTWQSDRHTDRQTTHNGTSRTYASHRATKIYIHTNKFRIKTAYHILCTSKLIQFSEYCTLLRCFLYKQSIFCGHYL